MTTASAARCGVEPGILVAAAGFRRDERRPRHTGYLGGPTSQRWQYRSNPLTQINAVSEAVTDIISMHRSERICS
jgi:hypothetical protein